MDLEEIKAMENGKEKEICQAKIDRRIQFMQEKNGPKTGNQK